ncbi:hypothetical protein [Phyllobacterium sp. P30BS-XVII]|uniref:hypothetical protein n=1 Tax=Phyllobacterium sp. P30BS-XVII TaxID=2587046 RepID=UPI0013AF6141|nr:hypothetical protein [Phyllobacterium sp. P30BS-XVII]MBA8902644.1 hypothetical protein [Phyllobacterium sp. P30BS-XVII]
MSRHIPFVLCTLLLLIGCTTSGKVSPLIHCDNPADINARVFSNCTQHIGKESP